jgi:hypothetical protein
MKKYTVITQQSYRLYTIRYVEKQVKGRLQSRDTSNVDRRRKFELGGNTHAMKDHRKRNQLEKFQRGDGYRRGPV